MKVLVVCEDPTNDQYIVKPVVERISEDIGHKARVDVLRDPHLTGIDVLLAELPGIVADNSMEDLIIVVADRDGDPHGNPKRLGRVAKPFPKVLTCCAEEEVEIWMLALHRDTFADWTAIRSDRDVKDHFAFPFLRARDFGGPGNGRKAAMRELGRSWRGLLHLCPEIDQLRQQIREFIDRRG